LWFDAAICKTGSLAIVARSRFRVAAIFVFLLLSAAFYYTLSFVEATYGQKSYYKIRFWPPKNYIKG
jgi:hypothetical protein